MKLRYTLAVLLLLVLPDAYAQTQAFSRVTDAGVVVTRGSGSWSSSWGDVNNDGWMDVYVIQSPAPALHLNNGDGTFTEVTAGHHVTFAGNHNSAIFGDYDNDGYQDLYVSHLGPGTPIPPGQPLNPRLNFLYRNSGPPNYTLERVASTELAQSINMTWTSAFSDYDNDGDLDLFAWGDQGDIDLFWVNNGDGTFTQVTDAPFVRRGAFSAAGNWADFDGDGDQDLFVVNFMRTNNELYRNLLTETGTATLERVTTGHLVNDAEDDLAPSIGDYDNDGDLDIFMSVWNGKADALYRNDGNLTFTQVTAGPQVSGGTNSLGSSWFDYDNDGWLDLHVSRSAASVADALFRNNGDGTFSRVFPLDAGPIVSLRGFSSGSTVADYDNDGDMDVFVPNGGGADFLFRNEVGQDNNWLHVTTEGTTSNRSGIGALVRVKATINDQTFWQMRHVEGGPSGDRAQSPLRLHFGLGDATTIDSLVVQWPRGTVDTWTNVDVNQMLTLKEGDTQVVSTEASDLPQTFALAQNYPNPFNPTTTIRYHLPTDATVELTIYNVHGEALATLVQGHQAAGTQSVSWNGRDAMSRVLPSGPYVYRLNTETFSASRVMMLVK